MCVLQIAQIELQRTQAEAHAKALRSEQQHSYRKTSKRKEAEAVEAHSRFVGSTISELALTAILNPERQLCILLGGKSFALAKSHTAAHSSSIIHKITLTIMLRAFCGLFV